MLFALQSCKRGTSRAWHFWYLRGTSPGAEYLSVWRYLLLCGVISGGFGLLGSVVFVATKSHWSICFLELLTRHSIPRVVNYHASAESLRRSFWWWALCLYCSAFSSDGLLSLRLGVNWCVLGRGISTWYALKPIGIGSENSLVSRF